MLTTSYAIAQTPYDGTWKSTVADSTFIITVETEGDTFNANFKKVVTSTGITVYDSAVGPGYYALSADGVNTGALLGPSKVKGLMDDIRLATPYLQSFRFIFEISSYCSACSNTATLQLEHLQGVYSEEQRMGFPNNLSFIKQ